MASRSCGSSPAVEFGLARATWRRDWSRRSTDLPLLQVVRFAEAHLLKVEGFLGDFDDYGQGVASIVRQPTLLIAPFSMVHSSTFAVTSPLASRSTAPDAPS